MTCCSVRRKDGRAALLLLQQIQNGGRHSHDGLPLAKVERVDERGVWRRAEVRVRACGQRLW